MSRLKERGQAMALTGEWADSVMVELQRFARKRREFTAEQFRYDYLERGGKAPRSHFCWGALFTNAARRGLIRHVGRYVRARSAKTRAHPVSVWRAA